MTTSASLPMMRSICPQASAEPMPSPSGRACDVTTNRRRARISFRTRSSMEYSWPFVVVRLRFESLVVGRWPLVAGCWSRVASDRRPATQDERPTTLSLHSGLSLLPPPLFLALQQLLDPALQLIGTIDLKVKFGRPSQSQSLHQRVPNEISGRRQSFQRALRLCLIARHGHHHASRPRIVGHQHRTHARQPNPRIGEFAFEDGLDLFADGFTQPSPMIFPPTLLQ